MNRFAPRLAHRMVLLSIMCLLIGLGTRVESKSDNRSDFKNSSNVVAPAALMFATLTVDTTLDNPALLACTDTAPSDCSLRGAVIAANAVPGTVISLPAGTYQLTVPVAGENLSATGDLDVRGNNTSVVGAGAGTTIIQQTIADRVLDVNPTNVADFNFDISGVTITGGAVSGGGAGILCGGAGSIVTVTDCTFTGNTAGGFLSNGGAISYVSSGAGNLTVRGSTLSGNTVATGVGAGIRFSGSGNLLVENSSFTNNQNTNNNGAAINATGPGAGGTYIVRRSSFSNNRALGAIRRGGAIHISTGNLTVNFSRLVDNTSGSGNGEEVSNNGLGTVNVENNWWGINTGPVASDVFGGAASAWLQLRHSASPNELCSGASATLTADILGANSGTITASDLVGLPAFPATFSNAVNGTISGASPNFVDGIATATFTAGTTTGAASADATADHQTITAHMTVSANQTTDPADQSVCQGTDATFSTTATGQGPFSYSWTLDGSPFGGNTPSITIPTGSLSFGNHTVVVTVTGSCNTATQSATLTVNAATTATDPADVTVCQGAQANFSTSATGSNLHYAWTLDGSPTGSDSPSLSVATGSLSPGAHTVGLTVTGDCGTVNHTATLTVQANTAASDPADQTVCQGATASFSTTASGENVHYAWTLDGSPFNGDSPSINVPTGSLSVGSHTVGLTVTGTCGTVNHTASLVVQASTATTDPADVSSCSGGMANFSTTASGTGPFHYAWTLDGMPYNGDSPSISINTGSLSAGTHTVTVTTTGACGSATQSANLFVGGSPTITLSQTNINVWPPNHQYQTFNVSDFVASASSSCDPNVDASDVVIEKVTSDELDENPAGADGNTINDIAIAADCKSVQLRRERDANLNGRVYTLTLRVRDSQGNTTTATVTVKVPKNNNGNAVDSGVAHTVISLCP